MSNTSMSNLYLKLNFYLLFNYINYVDQTLSNNSLTYLMLMFKVFNGMNIIIDFLLRLWKLFFSYIYKFGKYLVLFEINITL